MRGLAFRRHQVDRARRRALAYLRSIWAGNPGSITAGAVVRHAVDRTPCSCWMCGNPRRHLGEPTRQELRSIFRGEGEADA